MFLTVSATAAAGVLLLLPGRCVARCERWQLCDNVGVAQQPCQDVAAARGLGAGVEQSLFLDRLAFLDDLNILLNRDLLSRIYIHGSRMGFTEAIRIAVRSAW